MAQPSEADIEKKKAFLLSLLNSIDGNRLSDKQMCSILRSSVRQSWMQSPVRLAKIEQARLADMNPATRTKWLCECENCRGMFMLTDIEVDHIKGEHKLLSLADVEKFARSILDVTLDDLQIFCKPCHDVKTYAERHNMSFNEAKLEKKVIAWQKTNNISKQKEILLGENFSVHEISNHDKRRDAYRHILQSQ